MACCFFHSHSQLNSACPLGSCRQRLQKENEVSALCSSIGVLPPTLATFEESLSTLLVPWGLAANAWGLATSRCIIHRRASTNSKQLITFWPSTSACIGLYKIVVWKLEGGTTRTWKGLTRLTMRLIRGLKGWMQCDLHRRVPWDHHNPQSRTAHNPLQCPWDRQLQRHPLWLISGNRGNIQNQVY